MANLPIPLHVGIVGGGLGGLACAIALRRSGARVTILEQSHELGEIGAGIQITPNVSKFLIRWGVDKIIGDNLIQCECINFRDRKGDIIGYSDLKQVVRNYGFPWWVVRRDHLYSGLLEGTRKLGAETCINSRVVKIEHESSPVKVTTSDGKDHFFDFVIGADGLRSSVRTMLFPNSKPRAMTNNAAYRAVLPYDEVFEKVPEAKRVFGNTIDVWDHSDSYCICYPMSAGKDLNFVLSHHTEELQHVPITADMAELRATFNEYEPFIQKIIALIPQSQRWPLLQVDPLPSWSSPSKNIVLIGDAAHAMVNHLAQGAATSIEDGVFLGRAISDVIRGSISLTEAVTIYEKTRMPRAWMKQQISFTSGEVNMCPPELEAIRNKASRPEFMNPNIKNYRGPPPEYRSWNIWSHADTVPHVYGYDAESDADYAVNQYLQEHGNINGNTKVADRLEAKWMAWEKIEAKNIDEERGLPGKTVLVNCAEENYEKPLA